LDHALFGDANGSCERVILYCVNDCRITSLAAAATAAAAAAAAAGIATCSFFLLLCLS
jgi:hypothetical protein